MALARVPGSRYGVGALRMEGSSSPERAAVPPEALHKQLRQLVGLGGSPPGCAEELLVNADGISVRDFLLPSLIDPSDQAALFSEQESLSAIVRLLACCTGDPNGDTVHVDPTDPRADKLEQSNVVCSAQSSVAQALRMQGMVHILLQLLARHSEEFDRKEAVYLQLEALKALRLVIASDGGLYVGSPHVESPCLGGEEEVGYNRNGDTPRRAVEALLKELQRVGDVMGQKLKVQVLGSFWTLAATSSYVRTRIMQSGATAAVASLFKTQIRRPDLAMESAFVVECGVLAAIAAGGRTHERCLAKLNVDQDVLEMLRRFNHYRQVVCSGLVLLSLLANDDTMAARIKASPEDLATIAAARKEWSEEVKKALACNAHYVSPAAAALVNPAPPPTTTTTSARQRGKETPRVLSSRGGR